MPSVLNELGDCCCHRRRTDEININGKCGTTDVRQLQKWVLQHKAHVGLALDGDGDRMVMIDHLGTKVDGDQILYIIAREGLR